MNRSVINNNVLLLNQNYEPLQVCTARRAIVLVFQGKAEMIEKANGFVIRTVSRAYDLPSVVRLWHYKKVPIKKIILSRKNIILRDKNQCQYCETKKGIMTLDHIIPKKKGGDDSWENLVCCCSRCNNRKGDRTPDQAEMRLTRRPTRPTLITFIQRNISVSSQWRPFLFMDPS